MSKWQTFFEMRLAGGPASVIRRDYVPLADWFLHVARRHRDEANSAENEAAGKESSVHALLLAALALEAGANERAEEVIAHTELDAFDRCRGHYKRPRTSAVSEAIWKWYHLFRNRGSLLELTDEPLKGAQALFEARNGLVHYRMRKEPATTVFDRPPAPTDGRRIVLWSAYDPPATTSPSFIDRVANSAAATLYVAAAEAVFREWQSASS